MRILIATMLLAIASVAYAACTTHTYFYNGKMITCTTCCYSGNCSTTCI